MSTTHHITTTIIPGMITRVGEGHVGADVVLGDGAMVHESAYVDNGAVIGANSRVWHFAHVLGGAVVGARYRSGRTWS